MDTICFFAPLFKYCVDECGDMLLRLVAEFYISDDTVFSDSILVWPTSALLLLDPFLAGEDSILLALPC